MRGDRDSDSRMMKGMARCVHPILVTSLQNKRTLKRESFHNDGENSPESNFGYSTNYFKLKAIGVLMFI